MTGTILSIAAVLVFLCLFAFTTKKPKSRADTALGFSALLLAGIEVADQFALNSATDYTEFKRLAIVLESLLPATLLWHAFTFARTEPLAASSGRGGVLLACATLFPAAALVLSSHLEWFAAAEQSRVIVLTKGGYLYYLAVTLAFIAALMNLEATFFSTSPPDRAKIRYEIIGAVSILIVLIFTLSQGFILRAVNSDSHPVKTGLLVLAACLILYSKHVRGSGISVTVSRFMLYRSLTLLCVGGYFVALGVIGEGIKYFNVPLGRYLTVFLSFAGGMALFIAFLSETLRRSVMVFLSKHFFEHKHDYRRTWLDLSSRLASCMTITDLEKAIPAAYCEVFGLRSAYLYLFDGTSGRYAPTGQHEGSDAGFLRSHDLLSYFCERNRVWNPFDGEYDPDDEEVSFIRASRARLIVPLVCNRKTEGIVVFHGQIAAAPFTYEDYDLMKVLARQSALLLNNVRLSDELIEARELAATARISSFVVHDLKNLACTLSLTTHNANEHIGNIEFQRDMLSAVRNTLEKMQNLTQKLKVMPHAGAPQMERHDIRALSREVVQRIMKTSPGAEIVCRGDAAHAVVDPDELSNVIMNLIQNGIEAGGESGVITVETCRQNGSVCLTITDNGSGMTREFMQLQLFRPFRTTKKTGLGIGLYQCKKIVEMLGGTIEVRSECGKGSAFTVRLPAADGKVSYAA